MLLSAIKFLCNVILAFKFAQNSTITLQQYNRMQLSHYLLFIISTPPVPIFELHVFKQNNINSLIFSVSKTDVSKIIY